MNKDRFRNLVGQIPPNLIINTSITMSELSRRDFIKISGTGILSAILASCGVDPNSPNLNPNVIASPTNTDFEKAENVFNSFVTEHPKYKDREASVISFRINGVSANTIVMKSNDEEKAEIRSFENQYNGVPLQPYDEAVVFTMRTTDNNEPEWVRLSGVWFPTEDGSVITAWYYSPNAFNPESEEINFTYKVFGFNSRDSEYVFYPLVEPTSKLLWTENIMATNNPEDYVEWDGVQPYVLPVSSLPEGAGKALFSPVPVEPTVKNETPEETEAPVEVREFVPAETVDFSENLSSYELKLAPDADLKAIYWDIAVVQLGSATSKSQGMEENRKAYEEVIKDFPQWEGIGSGTDYKERVAFMKEFLKRTGGTMIVQDHNFNKFEVDFNKPVKFKVDEVDKLSPNTAYFLGISASNPSGRGGGGVLNSQNGQLSYTVEIVPEALENALTDQSYLYVKEKWSAGEIISNIFRLTISQTAYKDMDSTAHSYSLYTKGAEPKDALYYRKIHWTFIK